MPTPRVSIVIPTLNEVRSLPFAVASTEAFDDAEVLVADGGSSDGTQQAAGDLGCRLIRAPRGRARQMNAAARLARGEVLLFLHADCRLPVDACEAVWRVLSDSQIGCGAFRHRIDGPRRALRLIAAADNVRAGWLQRPYGDQAIFVRRELFERIGGFPEVELLEDVLLVRTLRKVTGFRLADATVVTDSRRWDRQGVLRTTAINWSILVGAACGLPNRWLARLYYGARGSDPDPH